MTFALNYILFRFVPSIGVAVVLYLEMICIDAQAHLGDLYPLLSAALKLVLGCSRCKDGGCMYMVLLNFASEIWQTE